MWRTYFLYYTFPFAVYCHLIYIVIYRLISRVVEVISLSVKSTYTLHHDGLAPVQLSTAFTWTNKKLWAGLTRALSGEDWFAGTTLIVDVTYYCFPQQCYANLHLAHPPTQPSTSKFNLSYHTTSTNTGSQPPGKISAPNMSALVPTTVQGKYTHQLIQIPRANLHIASILLQAVAKPLGRLLTALLAPAIIIIALLGLRSDRIVVRLPLRYFTTAGMATTEHAADGMANGRADCDTAMGRSVSMVGLLVWSNAECKGGYVKLESGRLTQRSKPSAQKDLGSGPVRTACERVVGQWCWRRGWAVAAVA